METISSKDARENLSEVLNKVAYGGESYMFTRHGNGLAVLISLRDWQQIGQLLTKLEDEDDVRDAEESLKRSQKEKTLSHQEMKKRLGL